MHNVKAGTCYPPTLVTTADHDDRVVPWHSYKFTAELQHAQSCPNPVMIRIETRAGHGAGKPVWMQIEDIADQFGFVANALKMPAPVEARRARPGDTSPWGAGRRLFGRLGRSARPGHRRHPRR